MRLVRYRKEGKVAWYALDVDHIGSLVREGFRHVEELLAAVSPAIQPHLTPAPASLPASLPAS